MQPDRLSLWARFIIIRQVAPGSVWRRKTTAFLLQGSPQLEGVRIERDVVHIQIVRMFQYNVPCIGPFHAFHQIAEMGEERFRMGTACSHQKDTGFLVSVQLILFSLCQCPETVYGNFQQAAVWPEKQRCSKHDDLGRPVGMVTQIHIVGLGTGPERILPSVKASQAGMDLHVPQLEDRNVMASGFR